MVKNSELGIAIRKKGKEAKKEQERIDNFPKQSKC